MLSSQALNVGRSLGQSWAFEHEEIFNSAVRGYHVYKVVWKPTIGKKLQADQICRESGQKQRNSREFTSQVLANFVVFYRTWRRDMRGSDWL